MNAVTVSANRMLINFHLTATENYNNFLAIWCDMPDCTTFNDIIETSSPVVRRAKTAILFGHLNCLTCLLVTSFFKSFSQPKCFKIQVEVTDIPLGILRNILVSLTAKLQECVRLNKSHIK